jgi:hypothetical protein
MSFDTERLKASAFSVGRTDYRKLYCIENALRVAVHSVLGAQLGQNWWVLAVDKKIRDDVDRLKAKYAAAPGRTPAGRHEIYYTFLPDLAEIIRANTHVLRPAIPDIDYWLVTLERLRNPRNLVGHMNWASRADKRQIQHAFADAIRMLQSLTDGGIRLLNP